MGWLVCTTTRCPSELWTAGMAAVAFANSTGMSITLLGVLGPVLQEAKILDRDPLKYQPVYLILYPVLQWSIGSYIFGLRDKGRGPAEAPQAGAASGAASAGAPGAAVAQTDLAAPSAGCAAGAGGVAEASSGAPGSETTGEPDLEQACKAAAAKVGSSPGSEDASDASSSASPKVAAPPEGAAPVGRCRRLAAGAAKAALGVLRHTVVPPVVGALLGILVAAAPEARAQLVALGPRSPRPAFGFCFHAVRAIGTAAVPVNMLVLGSNLSRGGNLKSIPPLTNAGIILMKQVGQPLVIMAVIHLLSRVVRGASQPAIALVMLIMSCTPTANNLMIMVEISGQNKEAMSACIFAQYVAAPLLTTFVVMAFLMLLQTSWFLAAWP